MTDASVLGIHPPSTVRIDMGGWVQDWPWEAVRVLGDRIEIEVESVKLLPVTVHRGVWSRYENHRQVALYYPYEHARSGWSIIGRWWRFHGSEDFTVTAGPPQAPSLQ